MSSSTVIKKTLAELFDRTRARVLGTKMAKPNRILLHVMKGFGLENTIEGLYRAAIANGTTLDADVDDSLVTAQADEAEGYIDELQRRTYRDVLSAVKSGDADAIKEAFEKATSGIETIIADQIIRTQNLAVYDGLMQAASAIGVTDPTMVCYGVNDINRCRYCLKMYSVGSNPSKPRAFKASQIVEGFFKPKEWNGIDTYRSPLHPRCRDLLTTILPGFGLDEKGSIKYVSKNYDEYAEQKAKGETW